MPLSEQSEPGPDLIEPGAVGRREVQMEARRGREPTMYTYWWEATLAPVRRHGDGSAVAPPLRGAIVQPPLLKKRIDEPYPDADDESDEQGDDDIGGSAVALILVVIVAWSVVRHARWPSRRQMTSLR